LVVGRVRKPFIAIIFTIANNNVVVGSRQQVRRKRELGDPRAVAASRATGFAYFAFGILGRDRADLPAWAIVRVLRDLGMTETAARGALTRLRQAGRIEAVRSGRTVYYHLTDASILVIEEMTRRITGEAPDWDGTFHGLLYSIPERHRAYRDYLRRVATLAGFGLLRPGLLVSPWADRYPIDRGIARAPAGSRILRLELQVPRDRARDVAGEAWELPKLATMYRRKAALLDRTTQRLTARAPTGRQALRTFATTMESVFETVVIDPGLPAELLPEDWPKASLAEAMERFYPVIGRQAVARLRELLPEIEIADPSTERPTPNRRPTPRALAEPSRPPGRPSAARI
jgi:phenylacetic acid degradation operon negative regulatory protein